MKDEIKEILDKLNNGKWEKDTEEITYKILFSNEVYKILDCITNLHEELEGTKDNFKIQLEYDEELENKITNLQEENKELKKKITFNEKSRRKMQQSLMVQIDKYKNVIDKIKEYCIKEQARIVINNTEEDEFVYTELLQLIDKLLEEVE